LAPIGEERVFALEQADQIANFADFCNYCGNCDTFCPEYDGPYLKKPNFYGSRRAFEAGAPHDGFRVEGRTGSLTLTSRIEGRIQVLQELPDGSGYRYDDGTVTLRIDADGSMEAEVSAVPQSTHEVDVGRLHALIALLRGICNPAHVNAVNAPLLSDGSDG